MNLRVNFLRLHPEAAIPSKKEGQESDYCYDVKAVREEQLAPNVWKYWLGFALQLDPKDRAIKLPAEKIPCFNLHARSSCWERGMMLVNSVGIVDDGYRGELAMIFYYFNPSMPRYRVGERIGQMKIGFTLPLEFTEVDKLEKTVRGEGGFGSTNIKP